MSQWSLGASNPKRPDPATFQFHTVPSGPDSLLNYVSQPVPLSGQWIIYMHPSLYNPAQNLSKTDPEYSSAVSWFSRQTGGFTRPGRLFVMRRALRR